MNKIYFGCSIQDLDKFIYRSEVYTKYGLTIHG